MSNLIKYWVVAKEDCKGVQQMLREVREHAPMIQHMTAD